MILKFKVTHPEGQTGITKYLELKWDFPLKKGGLSQKVLKEALEGLHGVEFVNMARYTSHIGYAEHVVAPDDLAHDIAEVLTDDKDFLYTYNKYDALREYGAAERIKVDTAISL